ncbi:DJ-1 family glyoxalase III [Niameybacter massiliensis]|uniref:DJ-1 family glyoxalase III n=1 Tax=Niameybacter massiliensis TaxID=1658108 RepID=UPI0006B5C37E|nr:DJ-1 family glyoxalase III [Niameybacter massiliensis]
MKVVVFFATGYEEVEALSVVDILRRGGVEVIMAGVDGDVVSSARGIKVQMDQKAEDINYDEIGMVVLPGGLPGVDNLFASELVKARVLEFKSADKWIAAICAGPSVLGKFGILEGEKATCYPGFEQFLYGATHSEERTVVSNKIVTGIGAGASLKFALKLLEVVKGVDKAEEIKGAMLIK